MTQLCRICGAHIPSGFTNCDGCYYKLNETKVEEKKLMKKGKGR